MNCCQRLQKVAQSPINRQIWSHWEWESFLSSQHTAHLTGSSQTKRFSIGCMHNFLYSFEAFSRGISFRSKQTLPRYLPMVWPIQMGKISQVEVAEIPFGNKPKEDYFRSTAVKAGLSKHPSFQKTSRSPHHIILW